MLRAGDRPRRGMPSCLFTHRRGCDLELPPPADPPYRILIVEDDPSQAMFAESVLSGAGMQARVVHDSEGAMAAMAEFQPELVLMDLHMPKVDGIALTTRIRGDQDYAHVPIVFLTGDPDPERQFEVLELGADDYLSKPVRPRHLIAAVQSRLQRVRAQRLQRQAGDATHPSTGLATRTHLLRMLDAEVPAARDGAVFFLEVEGAQPLRERYGYVGFDNLFTEIARQLGEVAQPHPAARLNDNTFLVHAGGMPDEPLAAFARRLRDGVETRPYTATGESLRVRCRVGYAAMSHGFPDAAHALLAAERALREARRETTGIRAYQPPRDEDLERHRSFAAELQGAIAQGRLQLAFQPIASVLGGDQAQYQILLRMRDANGEEQPASRIVPTAEASGLMHEIDGWVWREAAAILRRRSDAGDAVRLFVTQSAQSLLRGGHADAMLAALRDAGVEPGLLVVDMRLEDALIHASGLREFAQAMHAAGVGLCLSQFRRDDEAERLLDDLPLDYVRLAAGWMEHIDAAGMRDELRKAIDHAHARDIRVIGPQVEDPRAAATLWSSGVDYIQGNLVQPAGERLDFDFQHSVL